MTTAWYPHEDLVEQADGNQVQPEFAPTVVAGSEIHEGENVKEYTDAYLAFKTKFDNEYTP